MNDPNLFLELEKQIYSRADLYSRRAKSNTVLTVFSVFICFTMFVLSDRIYDFTNALFRPNWEGELDKAKDAALTKAARYVEFAPEFLVDYVRQEYGIDLDRYVGSRIGSVEPSSEKPADLGQSVNQGADESRRSVGPADSGEISDPAGTTSNSTADTQQSPSEINENPPVSDATDPPVLDAESASPMIGYEAPEDRNSNFGFDYRWIPADQYMVLALEQEDVSDAVVTAQVKAISDERIALINARNETERFVEQSNLAANKQFADERMAGRNAETQIELAREETQREFARNERTERLAESWASLSFRVGSVVLLVWLVRIFNGNREKAEDASKFYNAVADALRLCANYPSRNLIVQPEQRDQAAA
ncbi:hypothetical protein [Cereibacter azotoformans]|uniref:hypothetical protein n=1 Tax=Cereibacter azotoformans TaxID=43057 RepID=UPI00117B6A04|nr:hypothetical protein [Cereibacter azotoformans]